MSLKLLNKKIKHLVFGDGKVVSQEAERITIKFSEQYGTKQFVYPDAFSKYLKLYDADLEIPVMQEIHSKQVQINDDKEKRQQLYEGKKASEKLALEIEKKKVTKKKKVKS
jgi:hypothetical protein